MENEKKHNEFIQQRSQGIGGSDIAVIMGLNKYRSEYDLWLEKTGEKEPFAGNRFTKWGSLLEPVIIKSYQELQGIPDEEIIYNKPGEYRPVLFVKDPDNPFICHLDGIVWPGQDKEYILEVKTASTYRKEDFGQEGSDDIPEEYLLQCQWNMALKGVSVCHIPLLLGGNDERCYVAYRNSGLIEALQERAADWWDKHIKKGVEPPVSGSDSDLKYLRRKYFQDTGEIITIQDDSPIFPVIDQYHQIKDALDELEPRLKKAKNQIIQYMKDASILEYPGGRITYKKTNDGKMIPNWQAIARDLAEKYYANDDFDREYSGPESIIEAYLLNDDYTVPGRKGARRFLVKQDKTK